jgi:phosphatidylserine/phosphatidylglycerophosphate/cardiolipin synthase-like enzyme
MASIALWVGALMAMTVPCTVGAANVRGIQDRVASAQHSGQIEYAFSPGGAERLVLKVIQSARSEIRMMAYSLTSASVVSALIEARKRGVDVALVVDHKSNIVQDQSGKGRAALSALVNAGCRVRTVFSAALQHDKILVVDRETVQTGSFNYSRAATKNSENVLVVWENVQLAQGYLVHWQSRFASGEDFRMDY